MRVTRPRSIPNVDSARLVADVATLSARLSNGDDPRGNMVRLAAKRSMMVHELRARGVDVDVDFPVGSPSACAALFGMSPR